MIRVRRLGNKSLDMKAPGRRQSTKTTMMNIKDLEMSKPGTFWSLFIHLIACCVSMYIGQQLFKEAGFVVHRSGSFQSLNSLHIATPGVGSQSLLLEGSSSQMYRDFLFTQEMKVSLHRHNRISGSKSNSTRVGRHGILIRRYPHPDPSKVMLASELIDLLQEEQYRRFTPGPFKPVIVITPTFVRTFQRIHLIHLVNSLKQARAPLFWIVVEANGKSNETRSILDLSGIDFVHLGSSEKVPSSWKERELLEVHLREVGLRYVRAARMEGLVTFADDSCVLSKSFFDEVQGVKWVGALSVGVGIHDQIAQPLEKEKWPKKVQEKKRRGLLEEKRLKLPVQSPVCNENRKLIGWHTYPHYPHDFLEGLPEYSSLGESRERAPMLWLGFVLNSRILWEPSGGENGGEIDGFGVPSWIRPFQEWVGVKGGKEGKADLLKRLVRNESQVEPLGKCGRILTAWWLKADARFDSKYPNGWQVPNLEIVVPAKSTPWPKRKPGNRTSTNSKPKKSSEAEETKAEEEEEEKEEGKGTEKKEKEKKNSSHADKVSKAREDLGSHGKFAEKHTKSIEEDGGKH